MAEPFIGEIKMVGFNFAPRGWATCDGQLLPISQNTALFSLLGTAFGGDGRTDFQLPDLRGRDAVHVGSGPGLPPVMWGQRGGTHSYNLSVANLPAHSHQVVPQGRNGEGDESNPGGGFFASANNDLYADSGGVAMGAFASGNTGSGQSFNVTEPYLGVYHIIALTGLFPSRS